MIETFLHYYQNSIIFCFLEYLLLINFTNFLAKTINSQAIFLIIMNLI